MRLISGLRAGELGEKIPPNFFTFSSAFGSFQAACH